MGSTVIRLTTADPSPATLSLVAGVALAKAVSTLAPDVGAVLKWPNDLLIDGAKCAGILLERAGDSIVVGIGVNLVSAPDLPDRPTTCFADRGITIDRDYFARILALSLSDALWAWRNEGVGAIVSAWSVRAHPVGTPLRLSEQGVDGTFDGLAPDGVLRLRRADGEVMLVYAGEVEMRRAAEEGR